MTALDGGNTATLFVTNVLNGTVAASPNVVNRGTVVRIVLSLAGGSAPSVPSLLRPRPVGPTTRAAGSVRSGRPSPMTVSSVTVNGGDGNLVETTPEGRQVAVKILDTSPAPPGPNGNGTLFGLAAVPGRSGVYFVDDGTNILDLLA